MCVVIRSHTLQKVSIYIL